MTGGRMYSGDPMAALAGAYAGAFERGFRAWAKQAEAWGGVFARSMAWPPAAFPFDPASRAAVEMLVDSLSVQVAEMEDRVAMSVTCGDIRLDMMISHLPDAGADASVTVEDVAERTETRIKKIGRT